MINSQDNVKQHSSCHKVNHNGSDYLILESSLEDTETDCLVQGDDDPTHNIECAHLRREFTPVQVSTTCKRENLLYKSTKEHSQETDVFELTPQSVGESPPSYPWNYDLILDNSGSSSSMNKEEIKVTVNYGIKTDGELDEEISVVLHIDV